MIGRGVVCAAIFVAGCSQTHHRAALPTRDQIDFRYSDDGAGILVCQSTFRGSPKILTRWGREAVARATVARSTTVRMAISFEGETAACVVDVLDQDDAVLGSASATLAR